MESTTLQAPNNTGIDARESEALLKQLFGRVGRYAGQGVDGEGHSFHAQLDVTGRLGRAIELHYTARTHEGEQVFHEEVILIGREGVGGLAAWVLTGEAIGVERLQLVAASASAIGPSEVAMHFAVGEPGDRTNYRAALRLVLRARGALEIVWSCGQPGSDFTERSGLRLRPVR